jgi:hypothetical protein
MEHLEKTNKKNGTNQCSIIYFNIPVFNSNFADTNHACASCLRRSGFAQAGETQAPRRAGTDTVTVF